jgi:3-hydroxyisobutyrate dehydrogenase-like beta-hydroxyacid dehydrogenase
MTANQEAVGFVGLGAMGSKMVGALLESGWRPIVFDLRTESVAAAVDQGCEAATSPAAVADRAAVVMASLPTPAAVEAVLLGEDGLLEGGAMDAFVDLSTTGAATTRRLSAALAERGVGYLDAPVSGGVAGATERRLAAYVAGADSVFDRCEPLLRSFSRIVIRVGSEPGLGQLTKLLNNTLSATSMVITAEALALGGQAGIDPATLLEALDAGSGRNSATGDKFPNQVITGRFDSGFRLELMLKDLRLALDEAREAGVPMPTAALVEQLWAGAAAALPESADHTEIARLSGAGMS